MSEKSLVVVATWTNEFAEIVKMAPLADNHELQNDLFWFGGHPDFSRGQQYTDQEFIDKVNHNHMYKQRKFVSWDDIPDDVSMQL